MAYVDKFRKNAPKQAREQSDGVSVDVMPFILHGKYLEVARIDDEVSIEYMPLTLAEQAGNNGALSEVNEEYVVYAITKAFKYKFDNGLENPSEYLIDTGQSFLWNAKQFMDTLSASLKNMVIMEIQAAQNMKVAELVKWFKDYREDYLPGDFKSIRRNPSQIDSFLSFYYNLKDSSYTLHDIADLTYVQYIALTATIQEANVRSHNDQTANSNANKPKGIKPGKPKKPIVGG